MHKSCVPFKPANTAGENPSELWQWVNWPCCHCDTELEVFQGCHPLEKGWKPVLPPCAQRKKVQLLCPKRDSSLRLHSLPDLLWQECVLRGGEFSYGCRTTSLSELRRLWSLQNLGMLWWHCALLYYGFLNLCFDFSGPKTEQDNFPKLIQWFLSSPLPDFYVPAIPLCSWSCK